VPNNSSVFGLGVAVNAKVERFGNGACNGLEQKLKQKSGLNVAVWFRAHGQQHEKQEQVAPGQGKPDGLSAMPTPKIEVGIRLAEPVRRPMIVVLRIFGACASLRQRRHKARKVR